jgi:hypothetical protein
MHDPHIRAERYSRNSFSGEVTRPTGSAIVGEMCGLQRRDGLNGNLVEVGRVPVSGRLPAMVTLGMLDHCREGVFPCVSANSAGSSPSPEPWRRKGQDWALRRSRATLTISQGGRDLHRVIGRIDRSYRLFRKQAFSDLAISQRDCLFSGLKRSDTTASARGAGGTTSGFIYTSR